jgi:uncharacterized radical SAM protein YgiQ
MPACDVIFVLPYPFSDHPSFPEGILKRALESDGFRVGLIQTPFWQNKSAFSALGPPRLFFAVISGPVDSVVLNYTSTRKRRMEDLYQRDGRAFFPGSPPSIKFKIRPDRTVIVFSNRIREAFPDIPIVIGGVEATLRCFGHYDFQQAKIRRPILLDSRADILVTGMGERQVMTIARQLRSGTPVKQMDIRGAARVSATLPSPSTLYVSIPPFEELEQDPSKLLEATLSTEKAHHEGKGIVQQYRNRYVVEHPPEVYTDAHMDSIYDLPYTRAHLPEGPYSPALRMSLFSITSHRGCGGGCAFCAIARNQGKHVISRSEESILKEIHCLTRHSIWKGYVSDIGGGTAEMYGADCATERCRRPSCLHPRRCVKMATGKRYLELLRESRKIKGVKKIFIGSGIRLDLAMENLELLEEIMRYHSGEFLRIAPEHTESAVLDLMRKPPFEVLEEFVHAFNSINRRLKRKICLAPYLIVGHPGETFRHVINMKKRLKSLGLKINEVQIFTPSPGTLSTAMYYAGCSPDLRPLEVERNVGELQKRKGYLMEEA